MNIQTILRERVHARFHLSWGDVVFIKVFLSVMMVAVFFVPEPFTGPVMAATNLAWLWRL